MAVFVHWDGAQYLA